MPDLPPPKDATEAALFAECWDAVLSYADLCTAGSAAAQQLAAEAFTLGMREVRAAEEARAHSSGRRVRRLPAIPLLLTAVRTTAAAWEANGLGHLLDPDLRLWLTSERAARYEAQPARRPLALRGLVELQEADAALLWLAEVEALPLPVVARRLGLDPAVAAEELAQVRGLFRGRCHRSHLDAPMDAQCRRYARLLDAVTRSPADAPEDLSRHLARCADCAEAAGCLRLHGGGLAAALAGGVIGWGGLAYLERRRRAADVRLGAPRPGAREQDGAEPLLDRHRARLVLGGLLATAVLLSLLALVVSLVPLGDDHRSAADTGSDGKPVADLHTSGASGSPSATARPDRSWTAVPADRGSGRAGATAGAPASGATLPGQGTASPSDPVTTIPDGPADSTPAGECAVRYELVNEWPGGFQAGVTVTTGEALDTWRVAFSFHDGQTVGEMWSADFTQHGSRITATAADYDTSVADGGSLTFGFLGSWHDANAAPYGFTLNGHTCTVSS